MILNRTKDFFESLPVVGTKTFAVTLKKIRDWSQSNFSSQQMTKKEKRQTASKNEAGEDEKHIF